jgi:DNA-binding transcriptional LysR family regulator
MELSQLSSFLQIVRTGSFSKASECVFRSPSAISHQIKNLEQELEIKLFKRLGKTIRLTEEGKILFDISDRFFNDLDKIKRMFEDMQQSQAGSLVIITSSAIITYTLPNVVKMFLHEFKKIKFKLITCSITSEIPRMIVEGEAHFGIGPRINTSFRKNLNFIPWKSFDKILITAKGHPLSKKSVIKLADIAKYPIILYREGTVMRQSVEEAFDHNELSYEIIMEMDVAENIKKYVEMGVGLSIVSSLTLTPEDKKRFFSLSLDNLLGNTGYGIYYRNDKYITNAMRQFLKFFAPELNTNLFSF